MWITYIANGLAAIGGGVALFALAFSHDYEAKNRPNTGFWLGVLSVAVAIVVDFPLTPENLLKSIGDAYTFSLMVFMALVGLAVFDQWAQE